jgi:hypothetical protein
MQTDLFVVTLVALAPHLVLAGGGIDRMVVSLPARHRIGVVAFARYSRAADLGNGLILYPLLGISAPLATWAAFGLALAEGAPGRTKALLGTAAALAVLHTLTTARAAPKMLRIGRSPDDEAVLRPLLERFIKVSWVRAALQIAAAVVLLWALLAR